MNKALLTIVIVAAALALAGCEQFSTSYQRIDAGEFRLLNFIYEPADVAPGDTLLLTAVFAGRDVGDLDDHIDWWLSFDVLVDLFGRTTVVDSMRFEAARVERTTAHFSDNTQTVAFRIPIPANIVRTTPSIPHRWVSMLPQYMQDSFPPELANMDKGQMAEMIEMAADMGIPLDPSILQLFTVPIRIMAKMSGPGGRPHTIISNHTVRYNRRFHSAGMPINNNPVVDSVVVYKVMGRDLITFDSKTETAADSFVLYRANGPAVEDAVIEVANGFSYFIEAHTAGSVDSTTTMFGARVAERHYAYWQFALDKDEIAGVKPADYMDFGSIMGTQWSLWPPRDKRIKKFTFWVTVTDEVLNERLRPEGSTLVEMSGRFEYATDSGKYTLRPVR